MDAPIGRIQLTADDEGLIGLHINGQKYEATPQANWAEAPRDRLLSAARKQLDEYFAGGRTEFDVPLAPRGTAFQRRVWRALERIPFGTTVSYRAIAKRLRVPRSVRAVAAAIGRNPIGIIVPCHRVVGSDGSLTGYAAGLERKRALLELEGSTERTGTPKDRSSRGVASISNPKSYAARCHDRA
jgi:methylated-DNA-[protein]-cysteine S-methyltransferase